MHFAGQMIAMAVERRGRERRRVSPGEAVDVTRLEHENLCGQMDELLKALRRINAELNRQNDRISALEAICEAWRRVPDAEIAPIRERRRRE